MPLCEEVINLWFQLKQLSQHNNLFIPMGANMQYIGRKLDFNDFFKTKFKVK